MTAGQENPQNLSSKGVKLIPLTRGKFAMIDVEDYPFIRQFKWCGVKKGEVWYAATHIKVSHRKHKIAYMHRMVMNATKGTKVDHKDGNGLNNRVRGPEGNLRFCTQSENRANCKKRDKSNNSSQYRGVSWHKGMQRFAATIRKDKKNYHLGYFKSEYAAARMYDKAASKLHGEFAMLNFPTKENPRKI